MRDLARTSFAEDLGVFAVLLQDQLSPSALPGAVLLCSSVAVHSRASEHERANSGRTRTYQPGMPRTLLASRLSPPGPGPLLHRKLSHRRRSRNDLVMEQTWGLRPASSSATGSSGSSPSLPPASCTFPTARPPQSGRALYTLELNVTAQHVTTLWSSSCDRAWALRAHV